MTFPKSTFALGAFKYSVRRSLPLALTLSGTLIFSLVPTFAHSKSHHKEVSHKASAEHNARVAKHNAHLAKIAAKHKANLSKLASLHHSHLSKHNAKLAALHQARLAKHNARLAKLASHHKAKSEKQEAQSKALHSGNVVAAAYSLRGTRYAMGGTSRSGFDCSGFVRYILNTTGGVDLPRTATEQYYHGMSVSADKLQPGDLVFFKNTYKHGISHVGIYAGNGKFIHAANAHKGVREDSLNESYYQNHYAGARRVLRTQMRGL